MISLEIGGKNMDIDWIKIATIGMWLSVAVQVISVLFKIVALWTVGVIAWFVCFVILLIGIIFDAFF